MNKWNGTGRLTREPEMHVNGESKTARFTVATNRPFKNKDGEYEADFISCVAFGRHAEYVEKTCKQGTLVAVSGPIRTGSYTNKDGQKVYTTDVNVDGVEALAGRKQDSAPAAADPVDEELPFN